MFVMNLGTEEWRFRWWTLPRINSRYRREGLRNATFRTSHGRRQAIASDRVAIFMTTRWSSCELCHFKA